MSTEGVIAETEKKGVDISTRICYDSKKDTLRRTPPMRIAFFDAKPYDKPSFDRYGEEQGIRRASIRRSPAQN